MVYIPAERHEQVSECASSVQVSDIGLQVWAGWSGVHIRIAGEGMKELMLGLDVDLASVLSEEICRAIDEYAEVRTMRGQAVVV